MKKLTAAIGLIILTGCAEIKPHPTVFLEATVTEISDCHTFRVNLRGQKEAWLGCKLRLRTDRGWPQMEFAYQTMGENHYQVGQKVIIGLESSESKEIISIVPKL